MNAGRWFATTGVARAHLTALRIASSTGTMTDEFGEVGHDLELSKKAQDDASGCRQSKQLMQLGPPAG